jgi:hypothetical protein
VETVATLPLAAFTGVGLLAPSVCVEPKPKATAEKTRVSASTTEVSLLHVFFIIHNPFKSSKVHRNSVIVIQKSYRCQPLPTLKCKIVVVRENKAK